MTVASPDVLGLVVCGGASTRMGRDKALLSLPCGPGAAERTLLAHAVEVLAEVAGAGTVLAAGPNAGYGELGLETIADALPNAGPLAGLVAGLELLAARGARWLALLAVDLPGVSAADVARLLDEARASDLDLCLARGERGLEPLLAVYGGECLAPARAALAAGERRMISFHGRERADGRALALGSLPFAPAVLFNVNTPEDERRARAAEVA